jgi:plasmid stabilization system protein ParE
MTHIHVGYAFDALTDLDDLASFLLEQGDPSALSLFDFVETGLQVLTHQPGIGRPVGDGLRELILSRGKSGYLVKYRYLPDLATVRVLRVRHQCESGYSDREI